MAAQSPRKPLKLFISYAHSDSEVARKLVDSLKAEGLEAWHDRDILPGDSWASAVDQELRKADAMVLLLSPAWAASGLLQSEVKYALGAPRFDGRLISVILEKTKDYPWILDKFPMIQYRNSDLTSREIAQALRGPDRKGSAPLGLVRQRIGDKVHRQPNPQI